MKHKPQRSTPLSRCRDTDLLSCILLALTGFTSSLLLVSPDKLYILYVMIILLLAAIQNWLFRRIMTTFALLIIVLVYTWLVYIGYLYIAIALIITYIILLFISNKEGALFLSPLILLSTKYTSHVFSLVIIPSIVFFIGLAAYISARKKHILLIYTLGSVTIGIIAFAHSTGYIWLDNLWEIYLLSTIYALIVAVVSTRPTVAPYCPFHRDQYLFSLGTLLGILGLVLSLASYTAFMGYSLWSSGFILVVASSLVPRTGVDH